MFAQESISFSLDTGFGRHVAATFRVATQFQEIVCHINPCFGKFRCISRSYPFNFVDLLSHLSPSFGYLRNVEPV
ncbi:MAG: hypothetical protein ACI9BW_003605 [Gammaproteobacteria bacterium]|jgi:hypothetical protein